MIVKQMWAFYKKACEIVELRQTNDQWVTSIEMNM